MTTSDLRDMLAIVRALTDTPMCWADAYEFADQEITNLLAARKTKWAIHVLSGAVLSVWETEEDAENALDGFGEYVLPYKEKP